VAWPYLLSKGDFVGGVVGQGECCVHVFLDCSEGVDKCSIIVACIDIDFCIVCSQHNNHARLFCRFIDDCSYVFKDHLNNIALLLLRDHVLIPYDPCHPSCLAFFIVKHGDDELKHIFVDQDEETSSYACEEGMRKVCARMR